LIDGKSDDEVDCLNERNALFKKTIFLSSNISTFQENKKSRNKTINQIFNQFKL